MLRRAALATAAFALSVAAVLIPAAEASAHYSEYCEHSRVNGNYWQVWYDRPDNDPIDERRYQHYHMVQHSEWVPDYNAYDYRDTRRHPCGTGYYGQGEIGADVEVSLPVGTDLTGNVPNALVTCCAAAADTAATTDPGLLARRLAEQGRDVEFRVVDPALGIAAAVDAPASDQCAVGAYDRGSAAVLIEVAGREVADALGHPCGGASVVR